MPILIAHRGNMEGPSPEYENRPNYITGGLAAYTWLHCEIDVWVIGGEFFLGHDAPQHRVNEEFLINARLWCHAKNLSALERLLNNPLTHCFWHQEDNFTLTSRGYIWTYPGQILADKSIWVLPEATNFEYCYEATPKHVGICSDFIRQYHKEVTN